MMLQNRFVWMLLATAIATSLAFAEEQAPQPFDLLIRGGKIVDGSGNPWFMGDVAIQGDRIAAVGPLGAEVRAQTPHRRTWVGGRAWVYRHAFAFGYDTI